MPDSSLVKHSHAPQPGTETEEKEKTEEGEEEERKEENNKCCESINKPSMEEECSKLYTDQRHRNTFTEGVMKILVQTLTDKIIEVENAETIISVKCEIQKQQNIPTSQQQLFFDNKLLNDDTKTLQDYGIHNGDTLHLVTLYGPISPLWNSRLYAYFIHVFHILF